MTTQNLFERILPDLFAVYQEADKGINILTTSSVPVKFEEQDATKILESYNSYIKSHANHKTTDIATKFNNGSYSKSPYSLHHDIKIVAATLINKHKIGSKEYKEVDFFYKFSNETLMRELSRINLSLPVKEIGISELEQQLSDDFAKISTTYNLTNGEVLTFIQKPQEPEPSPYANIYANSIQVQPRKQASQPLFSSLIGKSELDTNPTIVGNEFGLSKVIPYSRGIARNDLTLDHLSPSVNKFPTPSDQNSSEILHDFFHPIWYTIPVPTWLNYNATVLKPPTSLSQDKIVAQAPTQTSSSSNTSSQSQKPTLSILQQRHNGNDPTSSVATLVQAPGDSFRSFAPVVDSSDSLVTSEFKANIWLNHVGFQEIEDIKSTFLNRQSVPESEVNGDLKKEVREDEEDEEVKIIQPVEEVQLDYETRDINIADLVSWDPEKIATFKAIKEDKKSILESPRTLQRLISTNILKLNRLRQERFAGSEVKNIKSPTSEEISLYNRTSKLITIAIQLYKVGPSDFSIEFSKKLPVLVKEYTGVLPGLAPNKLAAMAAHPATAKTGRLPSIRGPYKKKNRL